MDSPGGERTSYRELGDGQRRNRNNTIASYGIVGCYVVCMALLFGLDILNGKDKDNKAASSSSSASEGTSSTVLSYVAEIVTNNADKIAKVAGPSILAGMALCFTHKKPPAESSSSQAPNPAHNV